MSKTEERVERSKSAAYVRELRGPLPEDDPFFECVDGQQVLRQRPVLTEAQKASVREVIRELDALPADAVLSMNELVRLAGRLPGRPSTWTSARTIREARGPFPEDDPDA